MCLNPLRWKSRNFVCVLFIVLPVYILVIHKKVHQMAFETIIKNTEPEIVWEYVADFSNMKKLNPTIESFSIVDESGNVDHWKYSVRYIERLSYLPEIENEAHGHYSIRPDGKDFLISSEHRTCFFTRYTCLNSVSEFRFHKVGQNTRGVELVKYECPTIFLIFCNREVVYQRKEIMRRLELHFSDLLKKQNSNV